MTQKVRLGSPRLSRSNSPCKLAVMNALSTFFFCLIVLLSVAMGAHGEADALIFALTALSFCVLLSAYVVMPPMRKILSVRLPAAHEFRPDETSEVREARTFLGRALPLDRARVIDVQISTRYLYRLLAGFLLGLLLGWFLHVTRSSRQSMLDILLAELFTIACLLRVLKPCLDFFLERHLLSASLTTLAANYSLRESSLYSKAWYSFVDDGDLFRGGSCRLFKSDWKQGELAIVFYEKENPHRSLPNFGLHYHVLAWPEASVEMPAEATS